MLRFAHLRRHVKDGGGGVINTALCACATVSQRTRVTDFSFMFSLTSCCSDNSQHVAVQRRSCRYSNRARSDLNAAHERKCSFFVSLGFIVILDTCSCIRFHLRFFFFATPGSSPNCSNKAHFVSFQQIDSDVRHSPPPPKKSQFGAV